jgi:hypothetical protein
MVNSRTLRRFLMWLSVPVVISTGLAIHAKKGTRDEPPFVNQTTVCDKYADAGDVFTHMDCMRDVVMFNMLHTKSL